MGKDNRKVMNIRQIINEEINLQKTKNKLIDKLNKYSSEYKQERNTKFSKDAKTTAKLLKQNKIETAYIFLKQSKLSYDIVNTYHELQRLKDDYYIDTSLDPKTGMKSGKYKVWRAGDIKNKKNGIFFSIDKKGANAYSDNGTRPVNQYEITMKKPFVTDNLLSGLVELSGKPYSYFEKQQEKYKSTGDWWLKADEQISRFARKAGYDSITYVKPAAPVIRELVVFSKKQVKKI